VDGRSAGACRFRDLCRQRLGRHRWVIERTLAWFSRFRRLTIRYVRRAHLHEAFLSLAAALICWSFVQRWFL
jgi:hypothetical protein